MDKIKIDERLDRIERLLLSNKTVLTFDEAAEYIDMSRSYLHKLTSKKIIPFSKPNGKLIYFSKEKLDAWLLSNHSKSGENLMNDAVSYILKKNVGTR